MHSTVATDFFLSFFSFRTSFSVGMPTSFSVGMPTSVWTSVDYITLITPIDTNLTYCSNNDAMLPA